MRTFENIYQYLNYYNTKKIQLKLKMSSYQFKQKVLENGLEEYGTLQILKLIG